MRVMFLTSDKNGIYSRLAKGYDDMRFAIFYDLRVRDAFNAMLDAVSVDRDVEKLLRLADSYSVSIVAMGFVDEAFIREAAQMGIDTFIAPDKERISDIVYMVGGG